MKRWSHSVRRAANGLRHMFVAIVVDRYVVNALTRFSGVAWTAKTVAVATFARSQCQA